VRERRRVAAAEVGDLVRALRPSKELREDIRSTVADIVDMVRDGGDEAVRRLTFRLDGVDIERLRVPPSRLRQALADLDPDVRAALELLAENLRTVAADKMPRPTRVELRHGQVVSTRQMPVRRIGVYVPGGLAAYPSSAVMAIVPAQVAGVPEIAACSPPGPSGLPHAGALAVCALLGVEEIYAVGGAQAVAALAYGTDTIPAVDAIAGPGNAYVTAAKLLVSSRVGIDLPAGPSEVVVIADATADASLCAADLVAQAEHGPDSECLLLTDDAVLSETVSTLVDGYDNITIELVASLEDALVRSEAYAPEHLELLVADAEALLGRVRNAGTVFVGTSAVVGDYAAGATHVLPTGGLARATGGLGLESFLKPLQIVRADAAGVLTAQGIVGPFARIEGLPLHAAAVDARLAESPA